MKSNFKIKPLLSQYYYQLKCIKGIYPKNLTVLLFVFRYDLIEYWSEFWYFYKFNTNFKFLDHLRFSDDFRYKNIL